LQAKVPVHVFQSGQDHHVPPAMGRSMSERLASVTHHDCPDEGHLSIAVNRFDECTQWIVRGLV
jgi:pimeloyl-ACP methyl ester carboxylesterase